MPLQYVCDRCQVPINIAGFSAGDILACPSCGQTFSVGETVAPTKAPITPRRQPKKKTTDETVVAIVALGIGLAMFLACGGLLMQGGAPSSPLAARTGRINVGQGDALVCVDAESYDRFTASAAAGDRHIVGELMLAGRAFAVDDGTAVIVINPGILADEIRVTEGPMSGKRGFIAREFVQRDK